MNRLQLYNLLKGNIPNKTAEKVEVPATIAPQITEPDELTPKEVFLEIINKFNKKPDKGKPINIKKKKQVTVKALKEFFSDNFPIDEDDESIFN